MKIKKVTREQAKETYEAISDPDRFEEWLNKYLKNRKSWSPCLFYRQIAEDHVKAFFDERPPKYKWYDDKERAWFNPEYEKWEKEQGAEL